MPKAKIHYLSKDDFFELANHKSDELISIVKNNEVLIVKNLLDKEVVWKIRNSTFEWGQNTSPSWHPLHDNCPDYHRLHDNYPKAYVKQKLHGFYRHAWYKKNQEIFKQFEDIFFLKNKLGGFERKSFLKNIPSDNVIARFNVHHYPKGGGYQAEHIDPSSPFAKIQTLIMASQHGVDYEAGGVYLRNSDNEKVYLDSYADLGDMIVIDPGVKHGVDPIDPELEYSPNTNDGRWLFLPLFLFSDYEHEDNIKPQQVS